YLRLIEKSGEGDREVACCRPGRLLHPAAADDQRGNRSCFFKGAPERSNEICHALLRLQLSNEAKAGGFLCDIEFSAKRFAIWMKFRILAREKGVIDEVARHEDLLLRDARGAVERRIRLSD